MFSGIGGLLGSSPAGSQRPDSWADTHNRLFELSRRMPFSSRIFEPESKPKSFREELQVEINEWLKDE